MARPLRSLHWPVWPTSTSSRCSTCTISPQRCTCLQLYMNTYVVGRREPNAHARATSAAPSYLRAALVSHGVSAAPRLRQPHKPALATLTVRSAKKVSVNNEPNACTPLWRPSLPLPLRSALAPRRGVGQPRGACMRKRKGGLTHHTHTPCNPTRDPSPKASYTSFPSRRVTSTATAYRLQLPHSQARANNSRQASVAAHAQTSSDARSKSCRDRWGSLALQSSPASTHPIPRCVL